MVGTEMAEGALYASCSGRDRSNHCFRGRILHDAICRENCASLAWEGRIRHTQEQHVCATRRFADML